MNDQPTGHGLPAPDMSGHVQEPGPTQFTMTVEEAVTRYGQRVWPEGNVQLTTPFQVRSATVQHRRHGGVNGRGKGRGQGL